MYPHERSLVEKFGKDEFTILGVNSDKSTEILREEMKKETLTWPSFFDGGGTSGPIALRWGVRGWPTVYLIDAAGVIRAVDQREPDALIAELIAEAKAKR